RYSKKWTAKHVDNPNDYFNRFLRDYGYKQPKYPEKISKHVIQRRNTFGAMGINSTPSFLINGRLLRGVPRYSKWKKLLNKIIKRAKKRRRQSRSKQ
ncbi:MAG: DsbA family protein, partial [bacterium]